jgi:hypothetical protein
VFGEGTASNNAAWLRRKLSEPPDSMYGQGRCEHVRARDAGAAIWAHAPEAPGGAGGAGADGAPGAPGAPGLVTARSLPAGGRFGGAGGGAGAGAGKRPPPRRGESQSSLGYYSAAPPGVGSFPRRYRQILQWEGLAAPDAGALVEVRAERGRERGTRRPGLEGLARPLAGRRRWCCPSRRLHS